MAAMGVRGTPAAGMGDASITSEFVRTWLAKKPLTGRTGTGRNMAGAGSDGGLAGGPSSSAHSKPSASTIHTGSIMGDWVPGDVDAGVVM